MQGWAPTDSTPLPSAGTESHVIRQSEAQGTLSGCQPLLSAGLFLTRHPEQSGRDKGNQKAARENFSTTPPLRLQCIKLYRRVGGAEREMAASEKETALCGIL